MSSRKLPRNDLVIRGRRVHVDENGLARLNDIWSAAGFTKNQRPHDWVGLEITKKRIERVLELVTGKSRNFTKEEFRQVFYVKSGTDGGVFADIRLALDYAEYLNPKLAIEVKEVFLRYEAADATLADDILQRSSSEANRWAGIRALARSNRNNYTKTLKEHGVESRGYMECTEAVYFHLTGKKSHEMRIAKGLPPKANLRNYMDVNELSYVMAAEALSAERIEEEGRHGNAPCIEASAIGASAIRNAIELDRRSRQRPLG